MQQKQPQECQGSGYSSLWVRRAVPALPLGAPVQGLEKERGPFLGASTVKGSKRKPCGYHDLFILFNKPFYSTV